MIVSFLLILGAVVSVIQERTFNTVVIASGEVYSDTTGTIDLGDREADKSNEMIAYFHLKGAVDSVVVFPSFSFGDEWTQAPGLVLHSNQILERTVPSTKFMRMVFNKSQAKGCEILFSYQKRNK